MRTTKLTVWLSVLAVWLLGYSPSAMACAVCFGESEAPIAKGVAWGILFLLIVVLTVLGTITGFFLYLAKRAGSHPDAAMAQPGLVRDNQ